MAESSDAAVLSFDESSEEVLEELSLDDSSELSADEISMTSIPFGDEVVLEEDSDSVSESGALGMHCAETKSDGFIETESGTRDLSRVDEIFNETD